MKILKLITIIILIFSVAACSQVKPWQKGNFAKRHMRFDPNPLESKLMNHIYESREGSRGGKGASAGGCGCN